MGTITSILNSSLYKSDVYNQLNDHDEYHCSCDDKHDEDDIIKELKSEFKSPKYERWNVIGISHIMMACNGEYGDEMEKCCLKEFKKYLNWCNLHKNDLIEGEHIRRELEDSLEYLAANDKQIVFEEEINKLINY